jgi:hypothetical protein
MTGSEEKKKGALKGMIRAYLALYILFTVIALLIGQCVPPS